jgi:hypothetical protein
MSGPVRLAPSIHAVAVEEDLVILDATADAYYCLPGAGPAWLDLVAGRNGDGPSALTALLEAQGFLTSGPAADAPEHPTPELPEDTAISETPPKMHARDLLRLLAAWLDLVVDYDRRPFHHVLGRVRRGAPARPETVDDELLRLCRVFERTVIWLPVSGKCLVRSFLLLRFLRRSGRDAAWVFGVTTWPFSAHCWLQVGGTALDDRPERVRAFTPICAI